jgi:hypothetical protein
MVLVIVVPILAPIIMGTALSRVRAPDATMATIMEVVVELLWTIAVLSNPINKLMKGLEVAFIISSIMFLPSRLKAEAINSRESIKINVTINKATLWIMIKEVFILVLGLFTSRPVCFNDQNIKFEQR